MKINQKKIIRINEWKIVKKKPKTEMYEKNNLNVNWTEKLFSNYSNKQRNLNKNSVFFLEKEKTLKWRKKKKNLSKIDKQFNEKVKNYWKLKWQ